MFSGFTPFIHLCSAFRCSVQATVFGNWRKVSSNQEMPDTVQAVNWEKRRNCCTECSAQSGQEGRQATVVAVAQLTLPSLITVIS